MVLALGLVMSLLAACGGGNNSASGPMSDPEPLAGTVTMDNQTPWVIEVAWVSKDEEGTAQVVRVSVQAGQQAQLGELAAETEQVFDVVLLVPVETGPRVRRKALVQVNGDRVVQVRAEAEDPYDVSITVADGTGR
jgi:hypothetical protein